MVYEYSWGDFSYPVPAEIVGKECEKIEKRDGVITSESLLDSARDSKSKIHKLFEWDDAVAGEQWRLQQARNVLHNLKVTVIKTEDEEPKKIRAYMNTNPARAKGTYMNVNEALSKVDAREGILIRAKKELIAFVDKYSELEELSDVTKTIKLYLERVL